ncbi:hypothetical protein GLW08_02750 [Pontibacillus yanchengensis]|uniref:Uncharacterized protein n=2 Tax=Pontibacillus yanchengensis TaxID=462910 RepID=A0ACC7VBH6_9BACI|nr:hypothetical protein [Pontibacillus yanchengensis]MYL52253.1 hypothetical protein [Pontibacillus yanchengensis]
MTLFRNIES